MNAAIAPFAFAGNRGARVTDDALAPGAAATATLRLHPHPQPREIRGVCELTQAASDALMDHRFGETELSGGTGLGHALPIDQAQRGAVGRLEVAECARYRCRPH